MKRRPPPPPGALTRNISRCIEAGCSAILSPLTRTGRCRSCCEARRWKTKCPDHDSAGVHDFAPLDDLLICRYCSHTQAA